MVSDKIEVRLDRRPKMEVENGSLLSDDDVVGDSFIERKTLVDRSLFEDVKILEEQFSEIMEDLEEIKKLRKIR